jgi:hypothetical protein
MLGMPCCRYKRNSLIVDALDAAKMVRRMRADRERHHGDRQSP